MAEFYTWFVLVLYILSFFYVPAIVFIVGIILAFRWRIHRRIIGLLLFVIGSLELAVYSFGFYIVIANQGSPTFVMLLFLIVAAMTVAVGILSLTGNLHPSGLLTN